MMQYFISATLMLSCCLCFYKIFLRNETFYQLNRIVLVCCLVLSFALPLIRVPQEFSFRDAVGYAGNAAQQLTGGQLVPDQSQQPGDDERLQMSEEPHELRASPGERSATSSSGSDISTPKSISSSADDIFHPRGPVSVYGKALNAAIYLYWFGVGALLVNFLVQLLLLLRKAYSLPHIKDGRIRIVELPGDEAPSSFANIIFINPSRYDWDTYSQIIQHEKIHIEQRHSVDIILAELVIAFQWFNPFAWLFRKEVEINLEYLTDNQMLEQSDVERSRYQLSILKVSAPQMPLSLTNNYNQSLVKKRIAMMNAKRSNIGSAWKYIFMLPLLAVLMCLLNEPKVYAQSDLPGKQLTGKEKPAKQNGLSDEGSWFATMKGTKIQLQFRSDDESNSTHMSSFEVSELKGFSDSGPVEFTATREAGVINFKGKFEDGNGMGQYKFIPDPSYKAALVKEGIQLDEASDMMVMYFVNVKMDYVQMLKRNGFTSLSKNDLIPMASLEIEEDYIRYWKTTGYRDIAIHDLIALHSLKIDKAYVEDIKRAGYKDVSVQQLIAFKSQGIDGKYIATIREANPVSGVEDKEGNQPGADELISMKSMEIDPEYIKSMKAAGYDNVPAHILIAMKSLDLSPDYAKSFESTGIGKIEAWDLVSMKSTNVTPEFVKGFDGLGFDKMNAPSIVSLKSMQITPAYVKELHRMGYDKVSLDDVIAAKSMGVDAAYLKQFEDAGYKVLSLSELMMMKSQNLSVQLIRGYKDLGFKENVSDLLAANMMGVTPSFIKDMQKKGHQLKTLQKYVMLKQALD